MDKNEAYLIERVTAILSIMIIMVVDAFTWKIDHFLWSLGIAAISGLAGYNIGRWRFQSPPSSPPSAMVDDDTVKDSPVS